VPAAPLGASALDADRWLLGLTQSPRSTSTSSASSLRRARRARAFRPAATGPFPVHLFTAMARCRSRRATRLAARAMHRAQQALQARDGAWIALHMVEGGSYVRPRVHEDIAEWSVGGTESRPLNTHTHKRTPTTFAANTHTHTHTPRHTSHATERLYIRHRDPRVFSVYSQRQVNKRVGNSL
jgi:hypothetical protein